MWARSSGGEHLVDIEGVGSSILPEPTNFCAFSTLSLPLNSLNKNILHIGLYARIFLNKFKGKYKAL